MAKEPIISNHLANIQANSAGTEFNNGYLRIYSGFKLANCELPITNQTLLAELRFGNPAFGMAVNGVLTSNAITKDSAAKATDKASFFRTFKADGITVLSDGSVGITDDSDLKLNSVNIQKNIEVTVNSFIHKVRKQ